MSGFYEHENQVLVKNLLEQIAKATAGFSGKDFMLVNTNIALKLITASATVAKRAGKFDKNLTAIME